MTTQDQEKALTLMRSGKNVCLLGDAGTGKSWVLRKFLEENQGKNIVRCAPTGIAAINIGGVTLHRAFKIPVKPFPLGSWDNKPFPTPAIKAADIIVIDEISMCRLDVMDYIGVVLKDLKVQLIVVGDFGQLPPVIKEDDDEHKSKRKSREDKDTENDREILSHFYSTLVDGFPFEAECWDDFHFEYINLTEVVRQTDKEFISALNKVKIGDFTGLEYFNKNHAKSKIEGAVVLVGKNWTARNLNSEELEKIKHPAYSYFLKHMGNVCDDDFIAEKKLTLKVGARVIAIVNDKSKERSFLNGSSGSVIALDKAKVVVKFDNGKTAEVYDYTWDVKSYRVVNQNGKKRVAEKIVGCYSQIPLKLGYAITIHKSQGQTFEKLNIRPEIFIPGQLYVALSRAKSISNLCIYGWLSKDDLLYSTSYLEFMRKHNLLKEVECQRIHDNELSNANHIIHDRSFKKDSISSSTITEPLENQKPHKKYETQSINVNDKHNQSDCAYYQDKESIDNHIIPDLKLVQTDTLPKVEKSDLQINTIIVHKSFGKGEIINIDDTNMFIRFYSNKLPKEKKLNVENCIRDNLIIIDSSEIVEFLDENTSTLNYNHTQRTDDKKELKLSKRSQSCRKSKAYFDSYNRTKAKQERREKLEQKSKQVSKGSKVNHKDFGNGLVTAMDDEHITINFGEVTKQFATEICLKKKLINLIE